MKVQIWRRSTDHRFPDETFRCAYGEFTKDRNMIEMGYNNGNFTFIIMDGITKVNFIKDEIKTCPTCFKLMDEEKKDE